MIINNMIKDMMLSNGKLLIFITLIAVTLRGYFLFRGGKKVCFYKELLSLLFILYIISLYYLAIKGYSKINLIPFSGYKFGSKAFINYVLDMITLFIPFGFLVAYYLNFKKSSQIFMISLIITFFIEVIEYYYTGGFNIDCIILYSIGSFIGYLVFVCISDIGVRLPKFLRSDAFLNILLVVLVILFFVFSFDLDFLKYL